MPLNRLPDYLNSNISLTGVSADYLDGIDSVSFASALRANRSITGGGTITFDSSANLLWTTRFIVIANGRGPLFSTTGYFDIDMPPAGTVIPGVGGTANKTVSASGIPLNVWEALYYILPIGGTQSGLPGNFRVALYTSDLDIPYNWVLIAVRNGDTPSKLYLNNGIILSTSQVYNANSTSAYPYVHSLAVSPSAGTDTSFIEIGINRSGNGASYIDLIGDTTYNDFGLRIIRNNAGANTNSQISHRGTGALYITAAEAGQLIFQTTNTDRLILESGGDAVLTRSESDTRFIIRNTASTAASRFPNLSVFNYAGGIAGHPTIELINANGSLSSPSAVTSGQILGGYNFWGYNGSANASGARIEGVAEANFVSGSVASTYLKISTTNGTTQAERMRITASGNVGIGGSPISANGRLSVIGGRTYLAANSETYSLGLMYSSSTGQYYVGATNAAAPDLVFSNSGGTERMRITDAGNVGIGAAPSASYILDIQKTGSGTSTGMRVYNSATAASSGARIDLQQGAVNTFVDSVSNATGRVGTSTNHPLQIITNNTERIGITAAGVTTVTGVALGTTAANESTISNMFLTTSNGDYIRAKYRRISNGSDWQTAQAKIQRVVDVTDMGYLGFGGTSTYDVRIGSGTSDIAIFAPSAITLGSSTVRTTEFPADGTTTTATASAGYMGMPQVQVTSGGRTLAATDAGKHIYVTTNSSQTITIPANSAVAFPVGTTIVIVNANTISTSIAITTDTLRLANSTSTGTRTLASNGMCTLLKIASTEWIASGNGLT